MRDTLLRSVKELARQKLGLREKGGGWHRSSAAWLGTLSRVLPAIGYHLVPVPGSESQTRDRSGQAAPVPEVRSAVCPPASDGATHERSARDEEDREEGGEAKGYQEVAGTHLPARGSPCSRCGRKGGN